VTSPTPDPTPSLPTLPELAASLEQLREGIGSLAGRVTSLSAAIGTVNEIQAEQIILGQQAVQAIEEANRIDAEQQRLSTAHEELKETVVPREEIRARWRKENAGALLGGVALVAVAAVGVVFGLRSHHDVTQIQEQRRASLVTAYNSCEANNQTRDSVRSITKEAADTATTTALVDGLKGLLAGVPKDTDCTIYQKQAKTLGVTIPTKTP
jgi:hypothetical protein